MASNNYKEYGHVQLRSLKELRTLKRVGCLRKYYNIRNEEYSCDGIKGDIIFRSRDYIFEYKYNENLQQSFGSDLKKSMITEYGFKIETYNGDILEYHLNR